MREMPLIETDRLILRMGQVEDIPAILKFRSENSDHFQKWDPKYPPGFLTETYWRKKIADNLTEFTNDQSLRLFTFLKSAPDHIVANVNFSNFVRGAGQMCHIGYGVAENMQNQGLGAEAVAAAIDYAFKQINMHRIMANYRPENERSKNLLKKLGFTIEGNARQYLLIDGEWRDHVLTSLTNQNWQHPG